jgi:hypothetical protein
MQQNLICKHKPQNFHGKLKFKLVFGGYGMKGRMGNLLFDFPLGIGRNNVPPVNLCSSNKNNKLHIKKMQNFKWMRY